VSVKNQRARGSRCIVGPEAPVPETRGRLVLVLAESPPEEAGVGEGALTSFDEAPAVLAVVPHEHLLPADDRPCLSGDPRCCLLAPCGGCLAVLRAHLSDALSRAGATGEIAAAFVARWNELRGEARALARETVRQAKEWASSADTARPIAEAAAEEKARLEDEFMRRLEIDRVNEQIAREAVAAEGEPPNSPQAPVEKKRSTRAKKTRRQARSSSVTAPAKSASDEAGAAAPPTSPGAEVVAGPRGG
jgi:hypothetical protein